LWVDKSEPLHDERAWQKDIATFIRRRKREKGGDRKGNMCFVNGDCAYPC